MCLVNLTTFGYKPTNRAFTSVSARNFAGHSMPGCASWSSPTNLRSSKNGNVLNYCQARRRQVIEHVAILDRKSTRLNSSHTVISYAVFCLKKKKKKN